MACFVHAQSARPFLNLAFCPVSCGDPNPPPENAHQTNFGNTYGVVATFACDLGHEYSAGDTAMLCQDNGSWNGTALKCSSGYHYILWVKNEKKLWYQYRFNSCYVHAFVSSEVPCGQPNDGANADTEVMGTVYGSRVYYHCHPGYHYYYPSDAKYYTTFYRKCQHTGVWQSPINCTSKLALEITTMLCYSWSSTNTTF